MTRAEAERERERLSQEHPEATWLAREDGDGGWSVVRVGLPQPDKTTLVEEQEERTRPPYPEDPVGSTRRNFEKFGAN